MSNHHILFVFEGDTEFQLVYSLNKYLVNENILIKTAFCNDVYELYKEIAADPDLDTFLLIKGLPHNREILKDFKSSDFSEIYLFFDFDGHDNNADDEKLAATIKFFSEETEMGKIFISYPMIESIKHVLNIDKFKHLIVPAREHIHYKKMVEVVIDESVRHFNRYDRETWKYLLKLHLMKMNFIVNGSYTVPQQKISQIEIFENQKIKYIDKNSTVAVLNSIPAFILNYYKLTFIRKLTS